MGWMDEAEKRCEAATPGPWPVEADCGVETWHSGACWTVRLRRAEEDGDGTLVFWREGDARFYAAARTDLPHALALLREAVALLATGPTVRDGEEWFTRQRALLAAVEKGPGR